VRQRQPDGADLLPSRRQAVEDPARDDEMRARVVVREREAEPEVMNGGEGARRGGRSSDRLNDAAMSLQCEPSLHLTNARGRRSFSGGGSDATVCLLPEGFGEDACRGVRGAKPLG
jgi:hypothetical protein